MCQISRNLLNFQGNGIDEVRICHSRIGILARICQSIRLCVWQAIGNGISRQCQSSFNAQSHYDMNMSILFGKGLPKKWQLFMKL